MFRINRKALGTTLLMLTFVTVAILLPGDHEQRIYAQLVGASYPPGFSALAGPLSAFQPTLPSANAGALGVSNPASNGILNIQAGQAYCFSGALDSVGQAAITLVLPSSGTTTYLVVYNCVSNYIYAKTAVTAPGGQAGSAAPGAPGTFLAAIAGQEIPLATVVCNSIACGNGGNGSITDARPAANFSNAHINQSGTAATTKDVVGAVALAAGTATVTFINAYASAPVCVASDQTGTNVVRAAPSTTNVVFTGTGADVISYICYGNPN